MKLGLQSRKQFGAWRTSSPLVEITNTASEVARHARPESSANTLIELRQVGPIVAALRLAQGFLREET
jgi:hypothetical protein